jgi:hypothetical protein
VVVVDVFLEPNESTIAPMMAVVAGVLNVQSPP